MERAGSDSTQDATRAGLAGPAWVALSLVSLVAASFALRALPLWATVFGTDGVVFMDVDPYLHLRRVEYLVGAFPHALHHDPYALHPDGQHALIGPLFDRLVVLVAALLDGGRPTPETARAVLAIAPAALGALLPIPVYVIAGRIAGRAAGLLAAGAVVIAPGQLYLRTRLGAADHHALETLLVAGMVALLVVALSARSSRRALSAAAAAGVVAGAYGASWPGAAVMLLPLAAHIAISAPLIVLSGRSLSRITTCYVTFVVVGLAAVWAWPGELPMEGQFRLGLSALLGGVLALAMVDAVLAPRLSSGRRAAALVGVSVLGLAAVQFAAPQVLDGVRGALGWFFASGTQTTVGEALPLLRAPDGDLSLRRSWLFFGTATVILPIALAWSLVRAWREQSAVQLLFACWGCWTLALTIGQNRFAYYAQVAGAVAVGILLGPVLMWAWRDERPRFAALRMVVLPLAVFGAVLWPATPQVIELSRFSSAPDVSWRTAMTWLREETPEPFGDADAYSTPKESWADPQRESEYGVLAWWDVGYWVLGIGHRVPVTNPTQAEAAQAAETLLEQDPARALARARELGARYVVVSSAHALWNVLDSPIVIGGAADMVRWTGGHPESLYEVGVLEGEGGRSRRIALFHAAYYRSLLARLYVHGGAAHEPSASTVVTFADRPPDDQGRRVIESIQTFASHPEAEAHLRTLPADRSHIVGSNPFDSPVPLAALAGVEEVFRSEDGLSTPHAWMPGVRIFAIE